MAHHRHSSRSHLCSVLVALAASMVPAPAQAGEHSLPEARTAPSSERPAEVLHGRCLRRDRQEKRLTIAIDHQAYWLDVSPETKLERNGKILRWDDISVGDDLTIRLQVKPSESGVTQLAVLDVAVQASLAAGNSVASPSTTSPFDPARFRNPLKR